MNNQYYYLVAGLPELALDDSKPGYAMADFKTEIYPALSEKDKRLMDLFYLKFDNQNLLKLLRDKEASIDPRGNYTAEELTSYVEMLKAGDTVADKEFPAYLQDFVAEQTLQAADIHTLLPEDRLTALYYAYAMRCKNRFVASWFGFNLTVNNVLVALTARKYKWDASRLVVGDTDVCLALRTSNARDFGLGGEVEYMDQLMKIGETEDLVEREKKLNQLRWNWMAEATVYDYFSVERLFVFLVQLEMIERWISLDKERGSQLFRQLIESLKDEVKIPEI